VRIVYHCRPTAPEQPDLQKSAGRPVAQAVILPWVAPSGGEGEGQPIHATRDRLAQMAPFILLRQTQQANDALVRLCRAREMLREIHDPPLPLREVARAAALSPYHFIRLFKAAFGETPHQVRIAARLDRARDLLSLGEQSVTEIAIEVGFSSLGSFSHLFARRVGSSPSAYRRRIRSMVQVPGTIPGQLIPGCLSLMWGWPER
jgi:AraC-like DNA-binding protein